MSAHDWVQLAQVFGLPVVMLTLALVLGMKRVWVWGYQLLESEARADRWERLALRGTDLAESGTDIAQKLTSLAQEVNKGGTP